MRCAIWLVLIIGASSAAAQSNLWKHVSSKYDPPELSSAAVSESQSQAISRLLKRRGASGGWDCEADELEEMLKGLKFEVIPLSPKGNVLLVEAGAGCARGGQGSNGAMWLIRFDAATPVLMASPSGGFSGWIYSIQPSTSHGYRDIVLGWHMGGRKEGLDYFRFDGKSYRAIGSATLNEEDEDDPKIIPNKG